MSEMDDFKVEAHGTVTPPPETDEEAEAVDEDDEETE